jgi:signal transduction histidine kinase
MTIGAALTIGITLHKSIELGDRRKRFVSSVTHEMRTPLTTFRMYSEMLAKGLVRDETQRREYLQTLCEESERLSAMVENVLAHARLEERVPRKGERLTLGELLSRVTPPLARQVEASGMTLQLDSRKEDPRPIEADVEIIGQILRNLVDNATKYAGNGRPATIHLQSYLENGSLNLKVRDHGPGIPKERSRAIFKPFDRGGREPSDPVPGIGLGLALARGLARDRGGDLRLETPPGGGACFHLVLPTRV